MPGRAKELDGVEVVGLRGPLCGPTVRYRDATIDMNPSGTLFRISLPGRSLDGWKGLCTIWDAMRLVDAAARNAACK